MLSLLLALVSLGSIAQSDFIAPEHGGGEAPWFPAPEQYGISADLPEGCIVDQAAYITRHGSYVSYFGLDSLYSSTNNVFVGVIRKSARFKAG